MKHATVVPAGKAALAVRAGEAVLKRLPADEKKLKLAAMLLEKAKLRRLGVIAVSGAAVLGVGSSMLQARLTRAALRRELRRQLAPVNKKLDALEEQNRELRRQNEALRRQLESQG